MRIREFSVALGCVLMWAVSPAAAQDAKQIVKKAIEAHGGADNLTKYKGVRSESKGVVSLMGADIEFTNQSVSQYPDKQKSTIRIDFMGNEITIVQMIQGDRVGLTVNGMSQEIPEAQKRELRETIEMQKILNLVPLLEDPRYELKTIPGVDVDGRATVGIAVSGKDLKEVKIYFDKETYLIVKSVRKALDPNMSGEEVVQETIVSDYKDFKGVKKPMKTVVLINGNKFMEATNTKVEVLEKIDDKEFSD
jgi:hypothetical protein